MHVSHWNLHSYNTTLCFTTYMPQNLSVKRDYIAMGNIILAIISTNNTNVWL